jgi:transposase-like protein
MNETTIQSKVQLVSLSKVFDEKNVRFLQNYNGFTRSDAIDYVLECPVQAKDLVDKIKESILNDKTISEAYKDKIRNDF